MLRPCAIPHAYYKGNASQHQSHNDYQQARNDRSHQAHNGSHHQVYVSIIIAVIVIHIGSHHQAHVGIIIAVIVTIGNLVIVIIGSASP